MKLNTISTSTIEAIISRNELIDNINNFKTSDLALISISEPLHQHYEDEQLPNSICNLFDNYLKVKFWDIEEDFLHYKIISNEIAKEIQDFILENNKQNKRFLVHCRAGQSRSAAVGKSIECLKYFGIGEEAKYNYQTNFNSEIDAHTRYHPNLTVFDKIVKDYSNN